MLSSDDREYFRVQFALLHMKLDAIAIASGVSESRQMEMQSTVRVIQGIVLDDSATISRLSENHSFEDLSLRMQQQMDKQVAEKKREMKAAFQQAVVFPATLGILFSLIANFLYDLLVRR